MKYIEYGIYVEYLFSVNVFVYICISIGDIYYVGRIREGNDR